jgi:cation diffusion facilitator CzcD-associated flavoprotein CzcO
MPSSSDHHQRRRHVAVIGAGAAGLCTAKALLAHGHTVEIFEKEQEIGGTCSDGGCEVIVTHPCIFSIQITKEI